MLTNAQGNVIGSAIGGVTNLLGALFQSKANAKENEKARNFELAENQKARDYATKMYERQQADALTQWQRQNDYDSPTAYMARLREAGLNPNLAYGSMQNGSPVVGSPEASQEYGTSDYHPSYSSVGNAISSFGNSIQQGMMDMELKKAQINDLEADAKEKGANTRVLNLQGDSLTVSLVTQAAREQQQLKLGAVNIEVAKSVKKLNEKTLDKITAEINTLNSETERNRAEIDKVNRWIEESKENRDRADKYFDLAVKEYYDQHKLIMSQVGLNKQQFFENVQTFNARLGLLQAQTNYYQSASDKNLADIAIDQLRLEWDKESFGIKLDFDEKQLDETHRHNKQDEYIRYIQSVAIMIGCIGKVASTILTRGLSDVAGAAAQGQGPGTPPPQWSF